MLNGLYLQFFSIQRIANYSDILCFIVVSYQIGLFIESITTILFSLIGDIVGGTCMPRTSRRKYEKVEEDEIDLVVKCNDSHEFYEKYRETFPTKKKGIDSISKIWKRRGEFIKKQPDASPPAESSPGNSVELEKLLTAQNHILEELSGVMKEHLRVSREILTRLPKHAQHYDDHIPPRSEQKIPEHKEPAKRAAVEKSNDIMIGS
jgi:hypothetical protein